MTHHETTLFILALALLLCTARVLGEVARRLRQPAVLGEILAGILLGPTVFGALRPDMFSAVFPSHGGVAVALQGITTVSVVLFLLVAGLEVDLSTIVRLRHVAVVIGVSSIVVPFSLGFGLGQAFPELLGMEPGANQLALSLFLGVALSISALPVVAKILIDLRLFRTDLGMTVVAVAIFHDLVGWMLFAVVLAMMQADAAASVAGSPPPGSFAAVGGIARTILLTLAYVALMLTIGRRLIDRFLPWLHAHTSWPSGILAFSVGLALFGAAITEHIGIHAIFGAFIVGVAIGDSPHLSQKTRSVVEQFIASIFAPIFFASIGLKVNFAAHFDASLVATILLIACVGETLGCVIGARWVGIPHRQSWAIGLALNARGAMEIVLATLALQFGVIGEPLFVALVVMALVTSIIAGPLMQRVLQRKTAARLRDYLAPRGFHGGLLAGERRAAIFEMCAAAAQLCDQPAETLAEAVWSRELAMGTALPGGLAIPHARIEGLRTPVVVVATSQLGVDFDASDGLAARLLVLVLAPPEQSQRHLEILADVARVFQQTDIVSAAARAPTYTRFLAVLNVSEAEAEAYDPPRKKPAAAPPGRP